MILKKKMKLRKKKKEIEKIYAVYSDKIEIKENMIILDI